MSEIEIVSAENLKEPSWHGTHILRPDLVVLADSIANYGILSPLIVQKSTGMVIDGTQRLRLVQSNKHLKEKYYDKIPVTFLDVGELDAMIIHVQLNRGRGALVAKKLSRLVRNLHKSKKLSESEFAQRFAMKFLELELMLDSTVMKHRDIKNHSYSRAWVPVEAPPGTVEKEGSVVIERPPNPDR
jgi:hypothetical protein